MADVVDGPAHGMPCDSTRRTVWVIPAGGRAVVVEDRTPGATRYRRRWGRYRPAPDRRPWLDVLFGHPAR